MMLLVLQVLGLAAELGRLAAGAQGRDPEETDRDERKYAETRTTA